VFRHEALGQEVDREQLAGAAAVGVVATGRELAALRVPARAVGDRACRGRVSTLVARRDPPNAEVLQSVVDALADPDDEEPLSRSPRMSAPLPARSATSRSLPPPHHRVATRARRPSVGRHA
jgi:hypothetical protein